jgi:branched-subunit amino acid transport protein AzlD
LYINRRLPGVSGQFPSGLALVIAVGIIYIGINGIVHPAAAAAGYGMPLHDASDFAFVRIKAVRDIVSGLVAIAFLLLKKRRELSVYILVATLIPIGDFLLVLFTGDHQISHLAIHGGTVIYMIIVGAILYWQSSRYDR